MGGRLLPFPDFRVTRTLGICAYCCWWWWLLFFPYNKSVVAFVTSQRSPAFVRSTLSYFPPKTTRRRTQLAIPGRAAPATRNDDDAVNTPAQSVRRDYATFWWTPQNTTTTTTTPFKINYRVEGDKSAPPLLLVHGFGANVNHFRFQFPALTQAGYRVYAIDLLGFGASDKPGNVPYSIELFTELLLDFVRAMDKENNHQQQPWIFAGNSIGGLCCLSLTTHLPQDSIAGIVLFNCAGGMTGFRYDDVPLLLRPVLAFIQNVVLGPQWGGAFFENFKTRDNVESILVQQGVYCDPTNVDEELLEILLGPSDDVGAQDVFLKVFGGPPGPTPESLLPQISRPILALWGESDPWTPVEKGLHPGSEFGLYAQNFTLVRLPNVGHCPHDEAPELVHSHMIPWIQSLTFATSDGNVATAAATSSQKESK